MGKERQRGIVIVRGKVRQKAEGCKDDLRSHQGESFIGGGLICQPVTFRSLLTVCPSTRLKEPHLINILWLSSFQNGHVIH